jgi:uroporphyrinogen III methyltransferase/synthase
VEKGKVYLVGAGPGDTDLLTVKGKRLIQKAEIILYDKLANNAILKFRKKNAELIDVGKRSGCHNMPQTEINRKLVELAKTGKKIVRLKGGDPFILGRGGEEAEHLRKNGIKFEIVPGVSSINGVTAYAGIPLTHRNFSDNFAVATGHQSIKNRNKKLSVPKADTLVYLMGVTNLPNILNALYQAGYTKEMSIAMIEQGTTNRQKVVTGTLANILIKAEKAGIQPPALIVVGRVVKLHKKISWF